MEKAFDNLFKNTVKNEEKKTTGYCKAFSVTRKRNNLATNALYEFINEIFIKQL